MRLPLSAVALVLTLSDPLPAQISNAEYAARREALAARIGTGVVVTFGATDPRTEGAQFRQYPSFAYLTGVMEEPDAAFLLVARDGHVGQAVLYLPAKDPRMALYTGFLPDAAAAFRRWGLALRTMDHLRPTLDSLVNAGLPLWQIPDVASRDQLRSDTLRRGRRFLELFLAAHPGVTPRNAFRIMDELRVVKSPAEIALLRKAAEISDKGQEALIRAVAPGRSEAQVEAAGTYVFRTEGGDGVAYYPIIGSGPGSTSYHYRANNRVMKAGDVVVMDDAASYLGYAADITRTVPVSGKFTPEQLAIYRIVRASQDVAAAEARPGEPVAAGEAAIRKLQATELAKLGLIESPDATIDPPWPARCDTQPVPVSCKQAFLYMAHGPGHGIGLEVHDAGGYSYSPTGKFQENEVFTIEPGIYISHSLLDMLPNTPRNREFIAKVRPVLVRYDNTGIRVEDDYLITATGVERITHVAREPEEIEALMAKGPATLSRRP